MYPASWHPIVTTWFSERFGAPTEAQSQAWNEIAAARDTLVMAPTGSGKTLAAFLAGLERLVRRALEGRLDDHVSIVYVSPLKALGVDVARNLQMPLAGLEAVAPRLGRLLPPIHVAVRSGDTTPSERARILRHPPHILITTPESLYLMTTSAGGRAVLRHAETVIVDEIHAVIGQKRGAHLALTLERLDALVADSGGARPQRIGLSATVEPAATAARFLTGVGDDGAARPCSLVDSGRRQPLDVGIEIPTETLGAIASRAAWDDIYTRIIAYLREHKTTLIFVPSRRLCERVAHDLEVRIAALAAADPTAAELTLGAHHGALAKRTRQKVEQQLQKGELRAVVATASLELGIDIGDVELVCQIGSPRSLAVGRQRIGRARHQVGGTPKGRIFALTRDELMECAALVRGMRRGRIDRGVDRPAPLDILAQQLVAAVGTGDWDEEALWRLVRRATPYAELPRAEFDQVVTMLTEGVATRRGRAGAHLFFDRVHRRLKARRGARMAALTSGGAIPDKADYQVIEDASEAVVGTLDEDFAIESMVGDVFLLGTTPWRVRRIETGRVRVALAPGSTPTVPFWNGEGLARTEELSEEVATLRLALWQRIESGEPREATVAWLDAECALPREAAEQAIDYITEGGRALGAIPTQDEVVAERFFDDAGGMQLVIHAPFGARINRAWGMGLRKKFCRTFDFELQAAATDDAVLLSLGEQHSFPLESIFGFLHTNTLEETLVQAALQAPMWETRWRWNATRALTVLRFSQGRRTPPYLLRMRAADALAAVFPDAAGCQDNHSGPTELPDHPLVEETKRDCLDEVMDTRGLHAVLTRLQSGALRTLARDTMGASPFSHGIIAANPYAFLDDAPLEERRTRAVSTTRPGELLNRDDLDNLVDLDARALDEVVAEAQPEPRDADELHDLLCTAGVMRPRAPLAAWFAALVADARAALATLPDGSGHWIAAERVGLARALWPALTLTPPLAPLADERAWEPGEAAMIAVHGVLAASPPLDADMLAARLGLARDLVDEGLARLEAQGMVLQGTFRLGHDGVSWCDRRILMRVHRRALRRLRADVAPVPPAMLVRFLARWQHVAPGTQLHGVEGLRQVLQQLEGYELPPSAWERDVLPARVADYQPEWLDALCLSGEVAWARLHLADSDAEAPVADAAPRPRALSGRVALYAREHAVWLLDRWPRDPAGQPLPPASWPQLSATARRVAEVLTAHGAAFATDLVARAGLPASDVDAALWELTRAGAVAADGFSALRMLIEPAASRPRRHQVAAGRWSLLHRDLPARAPDDARDDGPFGDGSPVEHARMYLRRYGVIMRALIEREPGAPPWRDLLYVLRRLEARGEVRGGRFVSGLSGEQFALPEAMESLRVLHREWAGERGREAAPEVLCVAAADPLNLVGVIVPGARVSPRASTRVTYRDGEAESDAAHVALVAKVTSGHTLHPTPAPPLLY